jgi:hypothetical protein
MLSQPSHKIVLGGRFEIEVDLGDHPKLHRLAGDGSDTRRDAMHEVTRCAQVFTIDASEIR